VQSLATRLDDGGLFYVFLFARGCNEAIISMVLNPASINLRNLVYGI